MSTSLLHCIGRVLYIRHAQQALLRSVTTPHAHRRAIQHTIMVKLTEKEKKRKHYIHPHESGHRPTVISIHSSHDFCNGHSNGHSNCPPTTNQRFNAVGSSNTGRIDISPPSRPAFYFHYMSIAPLPLFMEGTQFR